MQKIRQKMQKGKKVNENIVRLAKELEMPTGAFSEAAWDLEYEVKDVLDDGTVLIDYNPASDNILKLLMLGSKLERHFMDLEERIENCWV